MGDTMIRMSDVRFRWRRRDPLVLDIARFEVSKGERVFLAGPSGGGKTTLLNLLAGVTLPEAGGVSILGTDITALGGARRDAFRADHIGVIFQMFNLVSYLSLIDNVTLPCRFSVARRRRAVEWRRRWTGRPGGCSVIWSSTWTRSPPGRSHGSAWASSSGWRRPGR